MKSWESWDLTWDNQEKKAEMGIRKGGRLDRNIFMKLRKSWDLIRDQQGKKVRTNIKKGGTTYQMYIKKP